MDAVNQRQGGSTVLKRNYERIPVSFIMMGHIFILKNDPVLRKFEWQITFKQNIKEPKPDLARLIFPWNGKKIENDR